mmetsp:Transcript_29113/g.71489  ORF Transcript_29113/g.71489 Transcript_29113/m.71489 type:complete len:207 (+) Transcript_29113:22-642(+)
MRSGTTSSGPSAAQSAPVVSSGSRSANSFPRLPTTPRAGLIARVATGRSCASRPCLSCTGRMRKPRWRSRGGSRRRHTRATRRPTARACSLGCACVPSRAAAARRCWMSAAPSQRGCTQHDAWPRRCARSGTSRTRDCRSKGATGGGGRLRIALWTPGQARTRATSARMPWIVSRWRCTVCTLRKTSPRRYCAPPTSVETLTPLLR